MSYREAAGAESPASRPSASSSALAVILALLLVTVVSGWRAWRQRRAPRRQRGKQPAERAFRERARRRAEERAAAAAAAEAAAAEQAEADGRGKEGQQTVDGSPDSVTVQHLPQTSTAEGWQAREPLSDPASDGASEAGLAHGGRSTPSAPPHPEILSLAAATFDTGRRDAPESTIGGETTCIVCFTRPKTHAALPCVHQCVCGPCSARLRACPYCRTPAERWWHVRVV